MTSSLFNSLSVLAVTSIGLVYLFTRFILKSQAVSVKIFTVGFEFSVILVVNILLAFLAIRYIPIIGDDPFKIIGSVCLTTLMVIAMQKWRDDLSQSKAIFTLIWEVCFIGIFPYPLFLIDLGLHHYGSVRTMSYVEGGAFLAFATVLIGVYCALKFYTRVIYGNEGSPT